MPFPETKRVIYRKNPLDKVICQLRFPPILRIDSEPPAHFQDSIRSDYPLYKEKTEIVQEVSMMAGPQFAQDVLSRVTSPSVAKIHEFGSADKIWRVNLARTFVSLTTSEYTRWEDFRERLLKVCDPFYKIYLPPFYTRLGLRYIDVFDRTRLGLETESWDTLLQPYVLGLLSSTLPEKDIRSFKHEYEIGLNDKGSILKLVTSFVLNMRTGKKCYMADSDFNTPKRTKHEEVFDKLDFFHDRATRLIRWIITEKLHNAMEPCEI